MAWENHRRHGISLIALLCNGGDFPMPLWGTDRTVLRDGRLPTAGSGVKNACRKAAAFNSGTVTEKPHSARRG